MSSFTKGEINRLGERLRGKDAAKEDILALAEYRRQFGPVIFYAHDRISMRLRDELFPCILTGRLKRTKSIIRKLVREPKMNLARMTDLGGLRLVVDGLEQQRRVSDAVAEILERPKVRDNTGPSDGYRAIHVIGLLNGLPVEVQIRTLPQQLWANESESFGEQVKEGGGPGEQREYLRVLSQICEELDLGHAPEDHGDENDIFFNRKPLSYRLDWLTEKYKKSLESSDIEQVIKIIVFDSAAASIASYNEYRELSKEAALDYFEYATSCADPNRFDVLMLNSRSDEVLRVTHFRYYLN